MSLATSKWEPVAPSHTGDVLYQEWIVPAINLNPQEITKHIPQTNIREQICFYFTDASKSKSGTLGGIGMRRGSPSKWYPFIRAQKWTETKILSKWHRMHQKSSLVVLKRRPVLRTRPRAHKLRCQAEESRGARRAMWTKVPNTISHINSFSFSDVAMAYSATLSPI